MYKSGFKFSLHHWCSHERQIIVLLWSLCGFSISKMAIIISQKVSIKKNLMICIKFLGWYLRHNERHYIFLELLFRSSSINCQVDKSQYFEIALRSRESFWWLPFAIGKCIWRKRSCSKSWELSQEIWAFQVAPKFFPMF